MDAVKEGLLYKGVVLLNKPPIDKIAARVVMERHQDLPLPIHAFWDKTVCSPEQMLRWEENGIFPIDLGDEKYHAQGVYSATAYVMRYFKFEPTPGEEKLLELLADNNGYNGRGRGGFLKGFYMSMVWTVRELYELHGIQSFNQTEVVDRLSHVVHCFLQAEDGKRDPERPEADLDCFEALLSKVSKCNFAPLTPARYLRDMFFLGTSFPEIALRVTFWIDAWNRVQEELIQAGEEFQRMPKQWFFAGSIKGLAIQTDSSFVANVAARETELLVVKNPKTGHAAFMSKRLNLTHLTNEMKRSEPGLWHLQSDAGWLINGGKIYTGNQGSPSTVSMLVEKVQKFPPYRRPSPGRR